MKEIFKQIHRYSEQDFEEDKPFEFILPARHSGVTYAVEHMNSNKMEVGKSYKITVKKYMTEPATANFDFQDKWNNGIPMPMCIMQGEVLKETRGMYCMALGGQIERNATYCMCCGRQLTNPVSKLYGIGPECSAKLGLMIVESEEEAKEKLKYLEGQISNITWEGWVIKSAIKEWEVIDNE
jgi:hypothetical protein